MREWSLLWMVVLVFSVGCGGVQREPGPRSFWPQQSELDEAVATLDPLADFSGRGLYAHAPHQWSGERPTRASQEAVAAESSLELLLEPRAPGVITAASRCMAHQLAEYHRRHSALPSGLPLEEIAGRCGIGARRLSLFVGPRPRRNLPPIVAKAAAKSDADPTLLNELTQWGAAAVSDDEVVFVVARTGLAFEPFALALNADFVEIRGQAVEGWRSVRGSVSQGLYGVEDCERDGDVEEPNFALRCDLDPSDESATIAVFARGPEGIETELRFLVSPGAQLPVVLPSPHVPNIEETNSPVGLLEALNRVRVEQGLSTLVLVGEQQDELMRLARLFATHAVHSTADETHRMVRGGMAGWHMDVPIVRSHGVYQYAYGGQSAGEVLAVMLSNAHRWTLFHPDSTHAGFSIFRDEDFTFLAVITYDTRAPADRSTSDELFQHLSDFRGANGVRTTRRIRGAVGRRLRKAARVIAAGTREPHDEIARSTDYCGDRTNSRVSGRWRRVRELDESGLFDGMRQNNRMAIGVSAVDDYTPGEPFVDYIVTFCWKR